MRFVFTLASCLPLASLAFHSGAGCHDALPEDVANYLQQHENPFGTEEHTILENCQDLADAGFCTDALAIEHCCLSCHTRAAEEETFEPRSGTVTAYTRSCSASNKCPLGAGDCNNDGDCQFGLQCFQRAIQPDGVVQMCSIDPSNRWENAQAAASVPGVDVSGIGSTVDVCYKPPDTSPCPTRSRVMATPSDGSVAQHLLTQDSTDERWLLWEGPCDDLGRSTCSLQEYGKSCGRVPGGVDSVQAGYPPCCAKRGVDPEGCSASNPEGCMTLAHYHGTSGCTPEHPCLAGGGKPCSVAFSGWVLPMPLGF